MAAPVATGTLTHYRGSAKRGEMPQGLVGGVAVDHGFKPYSGLTTSAMRWARP